MIKLKTLINESFGDKTELQKETENFRLELIKKYPQLDDLYFYVSSDNSLYLNSIRVKLEDRHMGIGERVIREIKKFADEHDLIITLSPEPQRGYKKKLDRFYKNLGFVDNKGRKKDYRLGGCFGRIMYRRPGINEGVHYPVVVGIITMDGQIKSKETDKTHGDLNFKRGICWRYNPDRKTTYWHGDESEHDESDEINVDSHLQKKYGYVVQKNITLGGMDSLDNMDRYQRHHDDAHGIYENIIEGAISIHPDDKKDIDKYFVEMDKYSESMFKVVTDGNTRNTFVDSDDVISALQLMSDKLSSEFDFKIKYYFKNKSDIKGYYDKDTNIIMINLFLHSNFAIWRNGLDRTFKINSVNFKSIRLTFYHEFVHHIQTVLRKEKSGNDYTLPTNWSDKDKYMKRPWEQQAHAVAYLEKLKQELNVKKPEVILKQLKKHGLVRQDILNDLKKSDYKSWKAIMKQAIMSIISDIEDKKL